MDASSSVAFAQILQDGTVAEPRPVVSGPPSGPPGGKGGASTQAVTPRPPEPAPRRLRILIADDSPMDRRIMQTLLARLGQKADTVNDGEQAAAAVSTRDYDLVLMDVLMPNLDGIAATRRILTLATRPTPAIVAVTGEPALASKERCLEAGMESYLAKPLRADQLAAVVAAAAEAHKA